MRIAALRPLARLAFLLCATSAFAVGLAACDQDTYSSNPEDRRTHMAEGLHAAPPPGVASASASAAAPEAPAPH